MSVSCVQLVQRFLHLTFCLTPRSITLCKFWREGTIGLCITWPAQGAKLRQIVQLNIAVNSSSVITATRKLWNKNILISETLSFDMFLSCCLNWSPSDFPWDVAHMLLKKRLPSITCVFVWLPCLSHCFYLSHGFVLYKQIKLDLPKPYIPVIPVEMNQDA